MFWSTDYVICTVVEPKKKLLVFKPGTWSIAPRSRIALYGHDAKIEHEELHSSLRLCRLAQLT